MESINYEILDLVKKKMREQGAFNREAYKEYIEETIEYFRERGTMTDEDNDDFIKEQLLSSWNEVQDELADDTSK
ncbi:hypothetical protein ISS03_04425 [Patescibacteria group bacterium]|nr:hypothetical protein [Patescibacteria group bacterium]